ncbi:MAG: type II toxin-antitoxin system HicB family antitoxin [Desulfovibrio sp.]|jgi:predicted HicB family RNase H-like nuclease|nr:type II toxin-antitoxin system HicB family antitoxin [Desulfovibrio sp.]
MMMYKGYKWTVETEYEDEDGTSLHGKVVGIIDVIAYEARTLEELRVAFGNAVDDYLEYCASIGKEPDKPYSGRFSVKVDPSLHARLAAMAKEGGMAFDEYVEQTLRDAAWLSSLMFLDCEFMEKYHEAEKKSRMEAQKMADAGEADTSAS